MSNRSRRVTLSSISSPRQKIEEQRAIARLANDASHELIARAVAAAAAAVGEEHHSAGSRRNGQRAFQRYLTSGECAPRRASSQIHFWSDE